MFGTILINVVLFAAGLAALCGLFLLFTRGARRADKRQAAIRACNMTEWATLRSMHQTPRYGGGQHYMQLNLDVPQPNGDTMHCTIEDRIDLGWSLRPGDQVQVFLNPDWPSEIVLDKVTSPRYATANKQS